MRFLVLEAHFGLPHALLSSTRALGFDLGLGLQRALWASRRASIFDACCISAAAEARLQPKAKPAWPLVSCSNGSWGRWNLEIVEKHTAINVHICFIFSAVVNKICVWPYIVHIVNQIMHRYKCLYLFIYDNKHAYKQRNECLYTFRYISRYAQDMCTSICWYQLISVEIRLKDSNLSEVYIQIWRFNSW